MKLKGNEHGNLNQAKKQFLKDLYEDKDYIEFKKKAKEFGICTSEYDPYVKAKTINRIIKEFLT